MVSDGGVLKRATTRLAGCNAASPTTANEGSLILSMADGTWQRISERRTGDGGRVAFTPTSPTSSAECACAKTIWPRIRCCCKPRSTASARNIAVFDAHGALLAMESPFSDLVGLSPQAWRWASASARASARCVPLPIWRALEMAGTRGRTLEVQYNPMPNGGFAMTYTDIQRAQGRRAGIRATAKQMRLITDALPALIAYVDNQQIYRFTNQGYEDWFGIPRSEISNRPMREVLGPRLLTAAGIMSSARWSPPRCLSWSCPPPAQYRIRQATFIPHFDPDHGGVLGFFA